MINQKERKKEVYLLIQVIKKLQFLLLKIITKILNEFNIRISTVIIYVVIFLSGFNIFNYY